MAYKIKNRYHDELYLPDVHHKQVKYKNGLNHQIEFRAYFADGPAPPPPPPLINRHLRAFVRFPLSGYENHTIYGTTENLRFIYKVHEPGSLSLQLEQIEDWATNPTNTDYTKAGTQITANINQTVGMRLIITSATIKEHILRNKFTGSRRAAYRIRTTDPEPTDFLSRRHTWFNGADLSFLSYPSFHQNLILGQDISNRSITIRWSNVSGALVTEDRHNIYYREGSWTTPEEVIAGNIPPIITSAAATSVVVTGLLPGITYSFIVVDFQWNGSTRVSGARSDVRTATTTVTTINASTELNSSVNLVQKNRISEVTASNSLVQKNRTSEITASASLVQKNRISEVTAIANLAEKRVTNELLQSDITIPTRTENTLEASVNLIRKETQKEITANMSLINKQKQNTVAANMEITTREANNEITAKTNLARKETERQLFAEIELLNKENLNDVNANTIIAVHNQEEIEASIETMIRTLYTIERKSGLNGTWRTLIEGLEAKTYEDSENLDGNQEYFYRIRYFYLGQYSNWAETGPILYRAQGADYAFIM